MFGCSELVNTLCGDLTKSAPIKIPRWPPIINHSLRRVLKGSRHCFNRMLARSAMTPHWPEREHVRWHEGLGVLLQREAHRQEGDPDVLHDGTGRKKAKRAVHRHCVQA